MFAERAIVPLGHQRPQDLLARRVDPQRGCRYAACAAPALRSRLLAPEILRREAGASGTALPGQRGATLAVYSTLGYAGGFLGPLVFEIVLDLAGDESVLGWGLAFRHVAIVLMVGPMALSLLKPAGLDGDTGWA